MSILVCNVGSTSLKYRLYGPGLDLSEMASGCFEGIGSPGCVNRWSLPDGSSGKETAPCLDYHSAVAAVLHSLSARGALRVVSDISCVAFKAVAAKGITGTQRLTERVLHAMEEYSPLMPAHNPPYLMAIRLFMQRLPGTPMIASFETGFHVSMPPEAFLYSLPPQFAAMGVRRNGAHGASHEYVSRWVSTQEKTPITRLVVCHLGGSSSLCAVKNGRSIDTTIGLSLQSGLMHNNRVGDLDPFLSFYLMESLKMSSDEVKDLYCKNGGFLGMSGGLSNDLRDIEAAADKGNNDARLTLSSFCYAVKKGIGAYAAAMGGLDAVAFAGGIGENSPRVRAHALEGLGFLGLHLDEKRNVLSKPGSLISTDGSSVRVYVVATNEELIVAEKARRLLLDEQRPSP